MQFYWKVTIYYENKLQTDFFMLENASYNDQ
jgi:hypothetical protein